LNSKNNKQTNKQMLKIVSRTLLLIICICLVNPLGRVYSETCAPGNDPVAMTFNSSEIGRFCKHYSNINSCCNQKTVDVTFAAKKSAYPSTKKCAIQPSFSDSCSSAFYPIICFDTCSSKETYAKYRDSAGKLKICSSYAITLFKACRDYRHCDTTKACATSTLWADGCTKYQTFYASAQSFVESHGLTFIDGTDAVPGTCFSKASTKQVGMIMTAVIAMVVIVLLN